MDCLIDRAAAPKDHTTDYYTPTELAKKGVAAGLNNLIKTRDGERLSGGRSADEDFGDLCGSSCLD